MLLQTRPLLASLELDPPPPTQDLTNTALLLGGGQWLPAASCPQQEKPEGGSQHKRSPTLPPPKKQQQGGSFFRAKSSRIEAGALGCDSLTQRDPSFAGDGVMQPAMCRLQDLGDEPKSPARDWSVQGRN